MNAPPRKSKEPRSPKVGLSTLEDLLAIPEWERHHELIEGTIYPKDKDAASGEHGFAQW